MKILELTTQQTSTTTTYIPLDQVAQQTAQSIFDEYFATKPFTDDRSHGFKVSTLSRLYLYSADEYQQYLQSVHSHLLSLLPIPQTNPNS